MTHAGRRFTIALALVVAVSGGLAWHGARGLARLRARVDVADKQLVDARAREARARDAAGSAAAQQRLAEEEAARLRAEIEALNSGIEAQQSALAAEMARRKAASAATAAAKAPASRGPGPWTHVGRADPRAAFQSVLWAIDGGDVDALRGLIALDADAQREADRFLAMLPPEARAAYAGAGELVASLVVAQARASFGRFDVQRESHASADDMTLSLQMRRNGAPAGARPQTANLRFHRDAGGWRLLVPAKVIEGYRYLIVGAPTR